MFLSDYQSRYEMIKRSKIDAWALEAFSQIAETAPGTTDLQAVSV